MTEHIARWRPKTIKQQAKLVCLACDKVVAQDVVGGNPSDIIVCGECNATVEERAEALEEVANILLWVEIK